MNENRDQKVVYSPSKVTYFLQLHASQTEDFLIGKPLFNIKQLKRALTTLYSELNPDHVLPDYTPEFRKLLAVGLFYKVFYIL